MSEMCSFFTFIISFICTKSKNSQNHIIFVMIGVRSGAENGFHCFSRSSATA